MPLPTPNISSLSEEFARIALFEKREYFQKKTPDPSLFDKLSLIARNEGQADAAPKMIELRPFDIVCWGTTNAGEDEIFIHTGDGQVWIAETSDFAERLLEHEQEAIFNYMREENSRRDPYLPSFAPVTLPVARSFGEDQPGTTDFSPVTFRNAQDITLISQIEWQEGPEEGTFTPAHDYNENFNRTMSFTAPEREVLPQTVMELADGSLHFSSEAADEITREVVLAEDRGSELLRQRGWEYDFHGSVTLPIVQYGNMDTEIPTTITNSQSLTNIRPMRWEDKGDGTFIPAENYNDTINRNSPPMRGHIDERTGEAILPAAFIEMNDKSHAFMVCGNFEAIEDYIFDAQDKAIEKNEMSRAEILARPGAQRIPQRQTQERPQLQRDVKVGEYSFD